LTITTFKGTTPPAHELTARKYVTTHGYK